MKTLFIPAKTKDKLNRKKLLDISRKLPINIAIAYSIQFQEIAFEAKRILSGKNIINNIVQVLGCSKPKFSEFAQAILLIGSGRFHAISLALETKLPVYILNRDSFEKISEKDIKELEKKNKVSYIRFLNADKVGILISTKPGQQNLQKALNIKNKLKNKKSYLFIGNNINADEFENFGLNSWINTGCPRLDMDGSIINVDKLNIGK